jgi:Uma2 family endonuclease
MVMKTRVSLEAFLAMPETEPASELIDGEVVQKVAPNIAHAFLTSRIIEELGPYLRTSREARIGNELRHVLRSQERVFIPDVSVVSLDKIPRAKEDLMAGLESSPDFAIEVLSPGTSYPLIAERAAFYMGAGTRLLWIVDPQDEVVAVHRPDEPVTLHRAPEVIGAQPVLSAFSLDLAALFAILHEGEDQ